MSDLNQFTCTGRLGADPEARKFPDGKPVVNLRVAVAEQWRDRNTGERQERTLWMPVVVTNEGLCKVAEQYLSKGSRVALSGKLQTRSYDKDGQTHYVTELALGPFNSTLTLLDNAGSSSGRTTDFDSENARSNRAPATSRPAASHAPAFDPDGDDIPFHCQWQ